MERRSFLKSMFTAAGVLGLAAAAPLKALAMPAAAPAAEPLQSIAAAPAVATPADIEAARLEDVRWRYRRRRVFYRRRRVFFRRRRYRY